jgi:hypothetical protein
MGTRIIGTAAAIFLLATGSAQARGRPPHNQHGPHTPGVAGTPQLVVLPSSGVPHARLTIEGLNFLPRHIVHVEMDCPKIGQPVFGRRKWTRSTDSSGTFVVHTSVLKPKHVTQTICQVYALDVTANAAFLVSKPFHITAAPSTKRRGRLPG